MSRALVDAGEETITKLIKKVDDWWNPSKPKATELKPDDAAAYRDYGRRYIEEHGSLAGHKKVNYGGEEFSLKKNKDNPDGSPALKVRPKSVKDKENATRDFNEKKGFAEIQRAQDAAGRPQSETDELINKAKEGNKAQERRLRRANKGKKAKDKTTVGHMRAVGRKGSLDVPENRIDEPASENYATQNKRDPDDLNLRMAGAPTPRGQASGAETYRRQRAIARDNPNLDLSRYPDWVKQKIMRAKNSEEIDAIIEAYEDSLSV